MKFKDLPKEMHNYIVQGIRTAFARSSIYKQKLKDNRIEWYDGSRRRVSYDCMNCLNRCPSNDIQLDHIEPVVPTNTSRDEMEILEFIKRNTFSETQILCKKCHRKKSNEENKLRRSNKKSISS